MEEDAEEEPEEQVGRVEQVAEVFVTGVEQLLKRLDP